MVRLQKNNDPDPSNLEHIFSEQLQKSTLQITQRN